MLVTVATPPSPVVTLVDAKSHLGVQHDRDNTLIEGFVAAATAALDGPTGWLGRALGVQVLELTLEGFPQPPKDAWPQPSSVDIGRKWAEIILPCAGQGATINDVTYVADDGTETDVDTDTYEVTADGRLRPAHGETWPVARSPIDPVTVLYTCGAAAIPAQVRAAILIMTADLYANRESVALGVQSFEIKVPTTVQNLVGNLRDLRC